MVIIWVGVFAAASVSFFRPSLQVVRRVANLCLLFSPLGAVLSVEIALMSSWSSSAETDPGLLPAIPKARSSTAGNHPPIFIFVFDEWSHAQSFADGAPQPELANLRRLSSEAFNFQNAWSFSARTKTSMPALIYQLDEPLMVGKDKACFLRDGKILISSETSSLLRLAQQRGYATAMQGFYLPYANMLEGQADYCRSFCAFPRHEGLGGHMLDKFIRNLKWMTEPFLDTPRQILDARLISRRWHDINNWVRIEMLRLLDQCPRETFAIFHLPTPHGPFVLTEHGLYHGHTRAARCRRDCAAPFKITSGICGIRTNWSVKSSST